MTKVNAPVSSSMPARFAGNWLAGSAESRSARRRLNAILRLACMVLGFKRRKGLGMMAAALVVSLASPVLAQTVGEGKEITLAFPSRKEKVSMTVRGCTPTNCLAYLPVGPVLRQEISKGGAARISFKTDATAIDLQLPLDGLGTALGAI